MKCKYVGLYSYAGCNEDAIPGSSFCHAHRKQGPGNAVNRKIRGCGCALLIGLGLIFLIIIAITC